MKYNKKDKLKGLQIPKTITPQLAYLIGIFAGDGSINIRSQKKEYVLKCVGNPKDEKSFYKEIITPMFKEVFGFKPKLGYKDSNTTFGFVIYSKNLITYLAQAGLPLGAKYKSLKIPKIFLDDDELLINFIRGLFDTDGCISFKKKYKEKPYYPVISFSSKSSSFTKAIATALKSKGFKVVETYDYKVKDFRNRNGFTVINRIELNGKSNLILWLKIIGFLSPKHKNKIETHVAGNSGGGLSSRYHKLPRI